jgi:hypothetical protein
VPTAARKRRSRPAFAKAAAGNLRLDSERRLVEAAGVERELAGLCKYLMVLGFWANSRQINNLGIALVVTAVLSNTLISTVFLEK